jgi:hypothetical protein
LIIIGGDPGRGVIHAASVSMYFTLPAWRVQAANAIHARKASQAANSMADAIN